MMVTALVLSCLIAVTQPAQGEASAPWLPERAWEWHKAQPWLCGFNYVPSTAVNTTEFWQAESFDPETIDRELGWAEDVGFNTCRVFLQYLVWENDSQGLLGRMDRFLGIADKHGITVAFCLFDDCAFSGKQPYLGKQEEPVPGLHNSQWTPSPGHTRVTDRAAWPRLEAYVRDVVGRFAQDERVVFWDLYNEPGNSDMGDKSLPLVVAAFDWARAVRPTQPLTVAIWTGALANLNAKQVELSDVVSFHAYTNLDGMKNAVSQHLSYGRPVICTEWMSRHLGGNWETDLPYFKTERIGCYSWGLVNGRTQTQFPWGSPKGAAEPDVWFHDLFHKDGSPFRPQEVSFIKNCLREKQQGSRRVPSSEPAGNPD